MDESATPDLVEALTRNTRFLRLLAQSLVADTELAEDAVQDAFVEAIERPPQRPTSPRGWLTKVVRHRILRLRRDEMRRAQRERAVASPDGQESTAQAIERAETQRRIVNAVFELREPYRTVLLLRFFEELPTSEIARRLGVPAPTARTRVRRALAELRRRLDSIHGQDRQRWVRSLVPLLGSSWGAEAVSGGVTAGVLTGGGVMAMKKALGAVAAICVLVAGWFWANGHFRAPRPDHGERAPPATLPTDAPVPAEATGRADVISVEPSIAPVPDSEDERAEQQDTTEEAPPLAVLAAIHGKVVDDDGLSIAGATVRLFDDPPTGRADRLLAQARTTEDGAFWFGMASFSGREPRGVLLAEHEQYSVGGRDFVPGDGLPITVVLHGHTTLGGVVLDSQDDPVRGAAVSLRYVYGRVTDSWFGIPDSYRRLFETWTDEAGQFELRRLPRGHRVSLQVKCEGYADYSNGFPLSLTERSGPVRIALHQAGEIRGRITYEGSGRPAVGVLVGCEPRGRKTPTNYGGEAVTDSEGFYRITKLAPALWKVFATLSGELAADWAVAAIDGVEISEPGQIVDGADLTLVRGGLLEFSVLDHDSGAPVPNVPVGVYSAARPEGGAVQRILTGPDGAGSLRLPPGMARPYLMGIAEGFLRVARLGTKEREIATGETQRVTFRLIAAGSVRGTVLDPTGERIAGAIISRLDGGRENLSARAVRSDREGRFRLSGFEPGEPMTLRAEMGDLSLPCPITVDAVDGEIPQVLLTLRPTPEHALRGRVVDAEGAPVARARVDLEVILADDSQFRLGDELLPTMTDDEGSFEFAGIWPDHRYRVRAYAPKPDPTERGVRTGSSEIVMARPGHSIDLEDIVVQ